MNAWQESQLRHLRIEAEKARKQKRKETLIIIAILAGTILLMTWR